MILVVKVGSGPGVQVCFKTPLDGSIGSLVAELTSRGPDKHRETTERHQHIDQGSSSLELRFNSERQGLVACVPRCYFSVLSIASCWHRRAQCRELGILIEKIQDSAPCNNNPSDRGLFTWSL